MSRISAQQRSVRSSFGCDPGTTKTMEPQAMEAISTQIAQAECCGDLEEATLWMWIRDLMSAAATPEPPSSEQQDGEGEQQGPTFEEIFKAFAKFGDTKNAGESITLSNSDKWFRQAKVIDGKKITTTDTGIYFKQVAKTKRALNISEYIQFLEVIAKNKKMDVEAIKQKLTSAGPPTIGKSTMAASSPTVARLTDTSKYTGTHKQRFDDSGKGKGKAGREEQVSESGYVQGYKDEGSYDKSGH